MRLKIFSSKEYLPKGTEPAPLLYPFWKDLYSPTYRSWISPYETYYQSGEQYFEMTSLEECDFAVLPVDWRDIRGDSWYSQKNTHLEQRALQFAELVKSANKPLIIFFGSDCSDEPLPIKDAIVFRQSPYRSLSRQGTDYCFPFFCEDFVEHYLKGEMPIRKKPDIPVIGFCGLATPVSLRKRLQIPLYHASTLLKQGKIGVSPYKGHSIRNLALNLMQNNQQIAANFVIRREAAFFKASDEDSRINIRLQYVENIVNSDYTLCIRGAGNYSNRFYEVISCGRIPIFVDTDCVLPWDSVINWKKYTVSLNEKELNTIVNKVLEFHNRLSPDEFIEMQHACRKLWKEWLSPEGFFSHLYLSLNSLSTTSIS